MVMKYLVMAGGETIAKFAVVRLIEKLGGKDNLDKLRQEHADAMKEETRRQIALLSELNQNVNGPALAAQAVATATSSGENAPCPACALYDETTLAQGYCQTIVQHCGEFDAIPTGYGGTVLQVREHLQKAIGAAHRLNEKPQFAQAGAMVAQGLSGLLQSIQGEAIACAQIKAVLPSLQEAVGVADRIAQLWWKKPEGQLSQEAKPAG